MTNFQFNDAATTQLSHTHTLHYYILFVVNCKQCKRFIPQISMLCHMSHSTKIIPHPGHTDARTKMLGYRMYHHRTERTRCKFRVQISLEFCVGLVLLLLMLPHEIHLYVIIRAKHPHSLSISVYLANEFINISVYSE